MTTKSPTPLTPSSIAAKAASDMADVVFEMLKTESIKVFLPDNELIWIAAEILEEIESGNYNVFINDKDYKVTLQTPARKNITMKTLCRQLDSLPLQNEGISDKGVNDMCTLNYLHEASILDNLRRRFENKLPYTYTGDICIAINPYQWLDIYTNELKNIYKDNLRHELDPHVYATSASAYRDLSNFQRNQSILVSGESGAGKTETVKILMGHVAHISGKKNDKIIDKVLQANPLLESFGNAKTSRNDNSSRFGKFTQLQFDRFSKLVGSKCVTYLLEKSRVIGQTNQERNYHIFHQMFEASESFKNELFLKGLHAKDFMYTKNGDTELKKIEGVTDKDRFNQTLEILALLGVNEDNVNSILRILSSVLHLGEIQYTGDADKSMVDPESFSNQESFCKLLGMDVELFAKKTTLRVIDAAGHSMNVHLSKDQAFDGRDALAKDLYNRLFLWLVNVVNESTEAVTIDADQEHVISLLDIFGFECFVVNRFEQLCINFANEKLQQKFTQDVFQAVQREYQEEGLDWEHIGYKDNTDTLELLESKMGILALLNEECLLPQGLDSRFLTKVTNSSCKHSCFKIDIFTAKDAFSIVHYAGKVEYTVAGFVERNKDALSSEIRSLMLTSENSIVKQLYAVGSASDLVHSTADRAQGKRQSAQRRTSFMKAETVTDKFRADLQRLMETISMTDVQYVRCIKPNSIKSMKIFDRKMVVEQLRCAGMIEAIRISRAAYPYRLTHEEFMQRFKKLRSMYWWAKRETKQKPSQLCGTLLKEVVPDAGSKSSDRLSDKNYEIGLTRIYFSAGILELLEDLRGKLIFNHIGNIQRVFRGRKQFKLYHLMKAASIQLKKVARCFIMKRRYTKIRNASVMISKRFRVWLAIKCVALIRRNARCKKLQAWYRMKKNQISFKKIRQAARVFTSWLKTIILRRKYLIKIKQKRENENLSLQLELLKQRLKEEEEIRNNLAATTRETMMAELKQAAEKELEELRNQLKAKVDEETKSPIAPLPSPTVSSPPAPVINFPLPVISTPDKGKLEDTITPKTLRGKSFVVDDLNLIEQLQHEIQDLRNRNDTLTEENINLKEKSAKLSSFADMKTGEAATAKANMTHKDKETEQRKVELSKMLNLITKLKKEKQILMQDFLVKSSENDDCIKVQSDLQRRYEIERHVRMFQHQATIDFLTFRGISDKIIKEIDTVVSTEFMPAEDPEAAQVKSSRSGGKANVLNSPVKVGYVPITQELPKSPSFDPNSLSQLNANYNKQINSIIQTVDKKILKDKEKRSLSQRTKITVADEHKPNIQSLGKKKTRSVAGRSEIDPRLAGKLIKGATNSGNDIVQHPPLMRKKHRARSDIGARPADYQREKDESSTLDSLGLSWLIPQNFLKNF